MKNKPIRIVESNYGECKKCGERNYLINEIRCAECGCLHDSPILYICSCSIKKKEYECYHCGSSKIINVGPELEVEK